MQTKPPPPLSPLSGDSGGSRPDGGQRPILSATILVMAGVLLSRVLGLVRDRVIAHQFGQGTQTDIYNAAFTIPDLINNVIAGGALASAFIPVFTEYMEKGKKTEAWRIFSFVAYATTAVVAALVLFGEIETRWLVHLFNSGWDPLKDAYKIEQTTMLTRILLPAQIFFFLGGLMMSAQQVRKNFVGQAFGPVIYNLGIILGGVFLAGPFGVAGLCWGAVGGAFVGNLLLQWILVRREGGVFYTSRIWEMRKHPGVREIGRVMLPILLLLSLPQVSAIVNKYFASYLGEGIQSALMNANRLMQLPLGLFAQAYGIAIFPTLSVHAARGDMKNLRLTVNSGLRFILFLTVPASLLMMILAMPIVQLILQTGKFHTGDARVTANVLIYYSVGIFAWSAQAILGRGFYSLKDSRTPMIIGTIVTFIFVMLNWAALRYVGTDHPNRAAGALALVTSLSAALNMVILLILLRNKMGGIEGGRLLRGTIKILVASGIMGLVCSLLLHLMTPSGTAQTGVAKQSAVTLLVCLSASLVVYAAMAFVLRMDETKLFQGLLRKLRRRRAR